MEETHLVFGMLDNSRPKYLMSHQCNDWRYRKARQPFTTVFTIYATNLESAIAGDDLLEVKVVKLSEISSYLKEGDSHKLYITEFLNRQENGNYKLT